MAKVNIVVTLVTVTLDDYNNVSIGHFSATIPPTHFSPEEARQILNEQAIPYILQLPVNYVKLTNLSYDDRGYAFNIIPSSRETRDIIRYLPVAENLNVEIDVEAPPDFSAETAF